MDRGFLDLPSRWTILGVHLVLTRIPRLQKIGKSDGIELFVHRIRSLFPYGARQTILVALTRVRFVRAFCEAQAALQDGHDLAHRDLFRRPGQVMTSLLPRTLFTY